MAKKTLCKKNYSWNWWVNCLASLWESPEWPPKAALYERSGSLRGCLSGTITDSGYAAAGSFQERAARVSTETEWTRGRKAKRMGMSVNNRNKVDGSQTAWAHLDMYQPPGFDSVAGKRTVWSSWGTESTVSRPTCRRMVQNGRKLQGQCGSNKECLFSQPLFPCREETGCCATKLVCVCAGWRITTHFYLWCKKSWCVRFQATCVHVQTTKHLSQWPCTPPTTHPAWKALVQRSRGQVGIAEGGQRESVLLTHPAMRSHLWSKEIQVKVGREMALVILCVPHETAMLDELTLHCCWKSGSHWTLLPSCPAHRLMSIDASVCHRRFLRW